MTAFRLPLLLAACLATTACATEPEATPLPTAPVEGAGADGRTATPPMPREEKPETPKPEPPPMRECDASNLAWAVGQDLDANLIERIRAETNSEGVRVLKPGMMATMDFRADRVNIDVDDDNRVLRVRCG